MIMKKTKLEKAFFNTAIILIITSPLMLVLHIWLGSIFLKIMFTQIIIGFTIATIVRYFAKLREKKIRDIAGNSTGLTDLSGKEKDQMSTFQKQLHEEMEEKE